MGIALGLGVILGVRAASGASAGSGAVLAVAALILAAFAVRTPRVILIFACMGCAGGLAAGMTRGVDGADVDQQPREGTVTAYIVSDPEITPRGFVVDLTLDDGTTDSRELTALMPAVPTVRRGDSIEIVLGDGHTTDGRVVVQSSRLIQRAAGTETVRNQLRRYVSRALAQHAPGSPGSLTLGLLIGDDSGLTVAERELLQRTGLSHITAVSGWNVTLVTAMIGVVFTSLGLRGWRWTLVQVGVLTAYVWLVGPDAPVVRAGIMGAIALGAVRLGRPSHTLTALVLAAAAMVANDPAALSSLSFKLSALATMALVVSLHVLRSVPRWRRLVLVPLVTSAATGIATAPLLAEAFGTATLLSIPANVAAAPLVSLATVGGIVTILSFPLEPLAHALGSLTWILAGAILSIARLVSHLPFGYWSNVYLPRETIAVAYTVLLMAAALLMPEGRFAIRRLGDWSRDEPARAAVGVFGCATAVTASLSWT